MLKDVRYIVRFQPVIYSNRNGASGGDSKKGFKKGRRVCAEQAYSLVLVLA